MTGITGMTGITRIRAIHVIRANMLLFTQGSQGSHYFNYLILQRANWANWRGASIGHPTPCKFLHFHHPKRSGANTLLLLLYFFTFYFYFTLTFYFCYSFKLLKFPSYFLLFTFLICHFWISCLFTFIMTLLDQSLSVSL